MPLNKRYVIHRKAMLCVICALPMRMPVQEVWQGDICNDGQAGLGKESSKRPETLMTNITQEEPTLPVRMALMRFWVSHMLEPDWPLLDKQVWLMMLAHACMIKHMRRREQDSG